MEGGDIYGQRSVIVMRMRVGTLALLGMGVATTLSGHPRLDGASIVNSGSTNTVGWTIAIRSNGIGSVANRSFSVTPDVAHRFLHDAQAAREASVMGRSCMKSASFGTRLTVTYHGWTSPDLSCPATSPLLSALATDAREIVAAAGPPTSLRRVRLPLEPHRAPTNPPRS